MTVTLHAGERRTLEALAVNVVAGKPRARQQAAELVPLLCDTTDALALFEKLVSAARDGTETGLLLDRLVGAPC